MPSSFRRRPEVNVRGILSLQNKSKKLTSPKAKGVTSELTVNYEHLPQQSVRIEKVKQEDVEHRNGRRKG
jgi:hypothetical protein